MDYKQLRSRFFDKPFRVQVREMGEDRGELGKVVEFRRAVECKDVSVPKVLSRAEADIFTDLGVRIPQGSYVQFRKDAGVFSSVSNLRLLFHLRGRGMRLKELAFLFNVGEDGVRAVLFGRRHAELTLEFRKELHLSGRSLADNEE